MAEKNKGQKPPLTMKQMEAGFGGKQIKETVKQSKSLSELVDTMKSQSKNVTEQVSATVDVEKSLKGLEGFMGINSTEQTAQLREQFNNLNAVMQEQVSLQEQGLPYNQELLDATQDQLDVLKEGVTSEEDKREALKKQEEANSLLLKMSTSFEKGLGKVKETGGFLAGIAGLATLLLNPKAFAKGIKAVIGFVRDMVHVVEKVFAGDFAGAASILKDNMGAISGILLGAMVMNAGKVLRAIRKVGLAFKTFSTFMKGTFVKDMLFSLGEKMKALGSTLMKPIRALVAGFKAFRVFMLTSFVPTIMGSLSSMMSSVGGAFMKAFQFLQKGFQVFRLFMLASFVPAMLASLAGMMAAIVPILIAMAPILLPILAVAALFGLMYLAMEQIREAMGFTSIFDVMQLGISHLQDAFGYVVNMIGSIVNLVLGLVEKFGKFLGMEIDLPEIPKMSTDNAKNKKIELEAKAEQAKIEEAEKAAMGGAEPEGIAVPVMPDMASMELPDIQTGTQLSDMSAENSLSSKASGTENNVVTQVQSSNTSNSGNSSTTVVNGHRPSRTSDFLHFGFGSFAR
jgi:hypothetical protein|tara:strand:- start:3750 stop:5456 length:1707 start_codon:yes stop_codon:yes gene_type:complete